MATHQTNRDERNDRAEQQARTKKSDVESSGDAARPSSRWLGRNQDDTESRSDASSAMGRASGSPFVLMRRMIEDVDRVLDNLSLGFPTFSSQGSSSLFTTRWSPGLDVFEREGKLIIRADLPGMGPEDVHLEVEGDNTLVLRGERAEEKQQESRDGVWRSERSHGAFRRTMRLPKGMDIDNATARFHNGVLEIAIAFPPEQQTRRIPIKNSGDVLPKDDVTSKAGGSASH